MKFGTWWRPLLNHPSLTIRDPSQPKTDRNAPKQPGFWAVAPIGDKVLWPSQLGLRPSQPGIAG